MEEQGWGKAVCGWLEEDGGITVWVQAAGDRGAARALEAQALRADGDALVGADLGLGAQAPHVGPPRAVGRGPQDGALFLQSQIPGGLWSGTQFAMEFFAVVMMAEFFEQRIGFGQGRDLLGREEWWEAFLPKIMGALDLAFGLRGGRIAQGDFVEAQGGAELGEGLGLAGEKEGVIVNVQGERQPVLAKSRGEEVEVRGEIFALVKAGAGQHAAVVIDDFQERRLALLAGKPAVRRSIVLPELSDLLHLPAPDGAARFFPRARRGQAVSQRPAAHRGPMDRAVMAAEHFGSGEAVGARGHGTQQLAQRDRDGLGQGWALIAA